MSKLIKGIAIFSSVVFGGMVIVGTATASGASFPQRLERLSQILSEGAEDLGGKARNIYGEGLVQFAKLFGAGGALEAQERGGGNRGGGSEGLSSSGSGSGHGVFQLSRPHNGPGAGAAGGDGLVPKLPNFSSQPGSLITGGGEGSGGLSAGALISDDARKPQTPTEGGNGNTGGNEGEPGGNTGGEHPAKTPIPGAVWLLGSSLAGLVALSKSRHRMALAKKESLDKS